MKEGITRHWEGRAKAYDENVRQVIYSSRERRIWQEIFSAAIGSVPLRILDVGTGPGIVSNLLSELGHDVTGIDASEGMLKKAQSNSEALHNPMHLIQGDGEVLPFDDGSFDAVVNRYVLWTLPQPERALTEWQRVLRPGGRLVYAVCSVLPEECADHLAPFLAAHPGFALVAEPPALWPATIPWNGGAPLLDPGVTRTDGYGILCLERR